jgi:hypothetical protein
VGSNFYVNTTTGTVIARATTDSNGVFQVQNAAGATALSVDTSSSNIINNGGAETGTTSPTSWSAQGSSTITRDTTNFISGTAAGSVAAGTTANNGVRITFASAPTPSTTQVYEVSMSVKQISGTAFSNSFQILYSPNNGTTLTATCSNYNTQTPVSTGWTKINCTFIPGSTAVTTALLIVRQTDAPASARTFAIDNVSVVQVNSTGTQNVGTLRVGGPASQGLTLFTLDTFSGTPFSGANAALAGSMYFDTSTNKIQCYDGSQWGACGAAPNSIVTITPEYPGAVLHSSGAGTDVGTMISDFCANSAALSAGTLCGSNDARNFYRWTSPQGSMQEYDIYVTYKLPSTFKNFLDDNTITLTARSDGVASANGTVTYELYKSTGAAITACGTETTVTTTDNTWQTVPINGNENSTCAFAANNNVIFKIRVKAKSNANVYVENINFTFTNQ